MRRAFILTILLAVTSLALTPVQAATPTPGTAIPACPLDGVTGMARRAPTVDEMAAPGSSTLPGYEGFAAGILSDLKAVNPDAAGVELVEPSGAAAPCWMVLARDGLWRVLWAVGEDGEWMEWPVYYVRGADGTFRLATEVNGQPITYKPVPGSENAHGTFEGDRESGKVLPILARQAVPTTDKGAVYSLFADMMKDEIEWKTVEGLGKVTTLPVGPNKKEISLETALNTGWEWKRVNGEWQWWQNILRNEKGETLIGGGRTAEIVDIFHVSNEGKFNYIGISGNPPQMKEYTFPKIQEGDEYTAFVLQGLNVPRNDMSMYNVDPMKFWFWTENMSTSTVKVWFFFSEPGDNSARLIVGIQHKVGNEIGGFKLAQKNDMTYYQAFNVEDPEFADLLKD